ncbi:hypothetical protein HGRIS_011613 [Hohenbuehelia grisea]|uniref:Uncharacterized protein n=1 Tax=Hohenbuehelia grisea TaxID=104357 RepID=A0ABR3JWG2_9AGAR
MNNLPKSSPLRARAVAQTIQRYSNQINSDLAQFTFMENARYHREQMELLANIQRSLPYEATSEWIYLTDPMGSSHRIPITMATTFAQFIQQLGSLYAPKHPRQQILNQFMSIKLYDLCIDNGGRGFSSVSGPEDFQTIRPGTALVMRVIKFQGRTEKSATYYCPVCYASTSITLSKGAFIVWAPLNTHPSISSTSVSIPEDNTQVQDLGDDVDEEEYTEDWGYSDGIGDEANPAEQYYGDDDVNGGAAFIEDTDVEAPEQPSGTQCLNVFGKSQ